MKPLKPDLPDDFEGSECPARGCDGTMEDVYPIETARSDEFTLVRIECPKCHVRAWRIRRPSKPLGPQQGF